MTKRDLSNVYTTKPFESRAQWAWAFATGQPWARRWAHETPGGKVKRYRKLPNKVSKKAVTTEVAFKEANHDGVMVAVFLPEPVALQIMSLFAPAVGPYMEPPQQLHITLVYFGDREEVAPAGQAIAAAVTNFAVEHILRTGGEPLKVKVGGVGRFMGAPGEAGQGETPLFLTVDSECIQRVQRHLLEELAEQGIQVASDHAFYPHITVAYLPPGAPTPTVAFEPFEIEFDSITLAYGGVHADFALTPPKPQTGITYSSKADSGGGGKRNYQARAGQQIAGNLCRTSSGKFGACGGGEAKGGKDRLFGYAPKPDQAKGGGGGGKGKGKGGKGGGGAKVEEGKLTPEQEEQKRAEEAQKALEDTFGKLQIAPDGVKALQDMASGKQPDIEAVKRAGFLEAGLMELSLDGKTLRMTPAGRQLLRAGAQGDLGKAGDLISESRDRMTLQRQREEARQQKPGARRNSELQKGLDQLAPNRQSGNEKGSGGGGGGKPRERTRTEGRMPQRGPGRGQTQMPTVPAPQRAPQQPTGPRTLPDRKPWKERKRRAASPRSAPADPRKQDAPGPIYRHKEYQTVPGRLAMFKQADGRLRWVMLSSNPYKDRDKQFVTEKSLHADVARTDKTREYGPLRWWHLGKVVWDVPGDWTTVKAGPGIDLGQCDFSAMVGRMLVESGTFYNDAVGAKIAQKADRLEVSLGFAHPENEPDANGAFWHIKRFERSLTPKGRASNPFTSFTVKESKMSGPMADAKVAALKELGLDDDDVKSIVQSAQVSQKAIDDKGITFKTYTQQDFDQASPDELASMLTVVQSQFEALGKAISTKAAQITEPTGGDEPDLVPTEVLTTKEEDEAEEEYYEEEADEMDMDDPPIGSLRVSELFQLIVDAVSEGTGPMHKEMGLAAKMADALTEMKSIIGGITTKEAKTSDQPTLEQQVVDLQTKFKEATEKLQELGETVPPAVQNTQYRPSRSDDNQIASNHSFATKEAQQAPQSPLAWVDSFVHSTGNGNGVRP